MKLDFLDLYPRAKGGSELVNNLKDPRKFILELLESPMNARGSPRQIKDSKRWHRNAPKLLELIDSANIRKLRP